MKMIVTFFCSMFLLLSCQSKKISDFEIVIIKVDSLTEIKQYNVAINLLLDSHDKLPDRNYEISQKLALLYGEVEKYDESFKIWNEGHSKGYFYGLFPHFSIYKPFEEFAEFDSIWKEDMRIRKDSIANSKTFYEISTPKNYSPNKKYPLMIILHGGGSSIERSIKFWTSEKLNNEYVVAFMQSYLYYDMKSFGWKFSDDRARIDLKECYNEIVNLYNIDKSKIVIGGISAGAYTSIDVSFNRIIPVTGYMAICPDVTANDFEFKSIKAAKKNNIRGVIISGENDYTLDNQKELIKIFDQVGLEYYFNIVPGMGHEYPENIALQIESALDFILEQK